MKYKVMYHQGDTIGLKTKVSIGLLCLDGSSLVVRGNPSITVPIVSLISVELFRLHGTGRMLKIVHKDGALFLSVIRFCLFGIFAVGNFFGTGRLKKELELSIKTQKKSEL